MSVRAIPLLAAISLSLTAVALAAPSAAAACVTDLSCFAKTCTAGFPQACVDPAACRNGDMHECVDLTTECLTVYPQCGPPP